MMTSARRILGLSAIWLTAISIACSAGQMWAIKDVYPLDIPDAYEVWWEQTVLCYESVEPDVSPAVDFRDISFKVKASATLYADVIGRITDENGLPFDLSEPSSGDPTIYIAAPYILNRGLVRHELLHAIIGKGGHPTPPFGRCAPF